MTPTRALEALAAYLGTVTELTGGAHYPAPAVAPAKSAIVRWRSFTRDDADYQIWHMRVDADIVAPLLNESQYDIGAIDPIVVAVADRFDPERTDAFHLQIADGGVPDGVAHCDVAEGEAVREAGYYAFRLRFAIKLKRSAAA